jgi:trigger factor
MKADLIDVSQCKKNIDIEIPTEVVDAEITHIAQDLARKARVPGFRPGKAPLGVVKTRFRDEIVSEMMHHLMPKYFGDAVGEHKLDIIETTPHFESVDYAAGKPLKFKAAFEVYPQLNISNYEGIPVSELTTQVDDSEVESSLKKLQEEMAELSPVEEDRPVQEGDFAEISYVGVVEGSDEPITGEKAVAEIGGRTTMKQFTENLTGARAGEEKRFRVEYREDYPEKRLAGKTVDYTAKVEAIKTKELPELNDEFASRFGQYKALDELRAKFREDLEKHKREHAQEQMREKMLEWLEDNNEFEIPDSLVERQLQIRVQRLLRDLSRQGINPQRLDVDWGKIREDQHQQAVRDVKGSLILEYVSEKENISVGDDEIEGEIEKISTETNRPKEKVREVLSRDSGLDRLRGQIRNKKTLDLLQEKARIQPATA